MALYDQLTHPADPEEFEKENKRVINKLRSDLTSFIAPEEVGIRLLRCDKEVLRRDWPQQKESVDLGKDYRQVRT